MKVVVDKSFIKDISKIDLTTKSQIAKLISQLNQASATKEIPNSKKIKGFKNAYRIRLGKYRIGVRINADTIILVRFIHRKDIYKYFPFFI